MDEEMEEGGVEVYEVVEFDIDYEFDAARYFDFTRPESEAEARESESWFAYAASYPPSPFVAKLFPREELHSENVDVSLKSEYDDDLSLVDGDTDIAQDTEYCDQETYRDTEQRSQALLLNVKSGYLPNAQNQPEGLLKGSFRGLSFYNHFPNDIKKTKAKSLVKPPLPRGSTLMKPTASQLAKQNQRRQVCDSRFQSNEGHNSTATLGVESQASKRQKLDGGLLRRIVDTKQPTNLIHKVPRKDGFVQDTISRTKLRITIPREPDLETAHRAERIRSTSTKEVENPNVNECRFKARRLNRKILEAPVLPIPKRNTPHLPDFHAFRLKTTERAKHHASTATSHCQNDKELNKSNTNHLPETRTNDGKRCDSDNAPKVADCQSVYSFKARRLDRKILTSRGDIGVFRNSKRDVTVPKEFEFQTSKRNQQNPPIDLFSKLSLAGETQPKSCAKTELPPRTSVPSKGSKENRWVSCYQDQNMKYHVQAKPDTCNATEIPSFANVGIGEIGSRIGVGRTFGFWRKQ